MVSNDIPKKSLSNETTTTEPDSVRIARIEQLKIRMDKLNLLSSGTGESLLNADIPNPTYLVDQIISAGEFSYIYGPGGQFKTSFCLYLACCLASGTDTFYFKVPKAVTVVWIDEELGVTGFYRKLSQISKGLGLKPEQLKNLHYRNLKGYKFDTTDAMERLVITLQKLYPEAMFIDSLTRVMTGDENSSKDVRPIHENIRDICKNFGTAVTIIHHTGKPVIYKGKSEHSGMRGSSDLGHQADYTFEIGGSGVNRFQVTQKKGRFDNPDKRLDFNFAVDGDKVSLELMWGGFVADNIQEAYDKTRVDILRYVDENGETYFNELKNKLKHKHDTIKKVLEEMVKEEILVTREDGRKIVYTFAHGSTGSGLFSTGEK